MNIGSISYNRHMSDYVYASHNRFRDAQNDSALNRRHSFENKSETISVSEAVIVDPVRFDEIITQIFLREKTSNQLSRFEFPFSNLELNKYNSFDTLRLNNIYRGQLQTQSQQQPYISFLA